MNHKPYFGFSAFLTSLMLTPSVMADADKAEGKISVDRSLVLADSIVNVTWNANYPKPLTDIVKRDNQTLTTTEDVRVDVRVIGAAFGPVTRPFPVQGWVKTTSSNDWFRIFLGNCNSYNPQTVVWSQILKAGEKLDFKFQGSYDNTYDLNNEGTIGSWQQAIDTTRSSPLQWNRMVFMDGEVPPNYTGAYDQENVHAHLAPYFETGKYRLKLGERDFIYLTELSPFGKGDSRTDMQDLVFLVTFSTITTTTTVNTTTVDTTTGNTTTTDSTTNTTTNTTTTSSKKKDK